MTKRGAKEMGDPDVRPAKRQRTSPTREPFRPTSTNLPREREQRKPATLTDVQPITATTTTTTTNDALVDLTTPRVLTAPTTGAAMHGEINIPPAIATPLTTEIVAAAPTRPQINAAFVNRIIAPLLGELEDARDPSSCATYAADIINLYFRRERPCVDYMPTQVDINASMRTILINWMSEVANEYHMATETFFLSKDVLDRILSIYHIDRDQLQLAGICALLLASKFEDVDVPTEPRVTPRVAEMVVLCEQTYTADQILTMERLVLGALNFNLMAVTPLQFVSRFVKAACQDLRDQVERERVETLANYYCEVSLLYYNFSLVRPSVVATSAVILALLTQGHPTWTPLLAQCSRVDWNDNELRRCTFMLQDRAHALPQIADLTSIVEKYAAPPHSVSGIPVPQINPFQI